MTAPPPPPFDLCSASMALATRITGLDIDSPGTKRLADAIEAFARAVIWQALETLSIDMIGRVGPMVRELVRTALLREEAADPQEHARKQHALDGERLRDFRDAFNVIAEERAKKQAVVPAEASNGGGDPDVIWETPDGWGLRMKDKTSLGTEPHVSFVLHDALALGGWGIGMPRAGVERLVAWGQRWLAQHAPAALAKVLDDTEAWRGLRGRARGFVLDTIERVKEGDDVVDESPFDAAIAALRALTPDPERARLRDELEEARNQQDFPGG